MAWMQMSLGKERAKKGRKKKKKRMKTIFFKERKYHQHKLKGLAIYVLSSIIFCVTQCIMSKQNKS